MRGGKYDHWIDSDLANKRKSRAYIGNRRLVRKERVHKRSRRTSMIKHWRLTGTVVLGGTGAWREALESHPVTESVEDPH